MGAIAVTPHEYAHSRLIAHELGHALVGMIAGSRVQRVWAPPPLPDFFDGRPDNPDELAGFVLSRHGDRKARTLALLGGPLAQGEPAPPWPIEPRTDDERKLAEIVNEQDELCYLQYVRDTQRIIESDEFERMHMFASELLTHPPHRIDERQLKDIMRN